MTPTTAPFERLVEATPVPVVPRPRFARRTLWAGLGLGAFAEWAFDGHALGLSVFLFGLATLGALRWAGGREVWETARPARWLATVGLFFAAFIAIRDSSSMAALNAMAALWCALAAVATWRGDSAVERWSLGAIFGRPVKTAVSLVPAGFRVAQATVKLEGAKGLAARWAGPLFRSMLLVTPVLGVVVLLLMSASSRFEDTLWSFAQAFFALRLAGRVGSALFLLTAALLCAGALSTALARRTAEPPADPGQPWRLGATEGFSLVASLTALIGLFDAVSLECSLFSSQCGLPESLTYAQYVHHGFAELLIVAGLVLVVLIALNRRVALSSPVAERVMRVVSSVLVLVTLPLVGSAVSRLELYEAAYGFTVARVLAQAVMVLVGALLVLRAVTLWVATRQFAFAAVLAAFATLSGLNMLDVEGFVTTQNVATENVSNIDTAYLQSLSADSQLAAISYPGQPLPGYLAQGSGSDRCKENSVQSWSVACARLRYQSLQVR